MYPLGWLTICNLSSRVRSLTGGGLRGHPRRLELARDATGPGPAETTAERPGPDGQPFEAAPTDLTLTITLCEILEDAPSRNRPQPQRLNGTAVASTKPPMALRLHHLLTPWSGDPVTQQQILGGPCKRCTTTRSSRTPRWRAPGQHAHRPAGGVLPVAVLADGGEYTAGRPAICCASERQ
jgi:Pvc16 N-terminal domain